MCLLLLLTAVFCCKSWGVKTLETVWTAESEAAKGYESVHHSAYLLSASQELLGRYRFNTAFDLHSSLLWTCSTDKNVGLWFSRYCTWNTQKKPLFIIYHKKEIILFNGVDKKERERRMKGEISRERELKMSYDCKWWVCQWGWKQTVYRSTIQTSCRPVTVKSIGRWVWGCWLFVQVYGRTEAVCHQNGTRAKTSRKPSISPIIRLDRDSIRAAALWQCLFLTGLPFLCPTCVFVCVTLCNTGFIGLLSRIVKGSLEPSHQQHQPEQQCMCECV